jgi:hypothetical protein
MYAMLAFKQQLALLTSLFSHCPAGVCQLAAHEYAAITVFLHAEAQW